MNEQSEIRRQPRRRTHSLFGALLLIAIGVVLLMKPLGLIEGSLWNIFLKLWPLLFIVSGLDNLYRGDSYVGGVVWSGLGVLFLLGNLGYLQFAGWELILRLWPFLFIIWGLDIIFNRRSYLSAGLGVLVGAGLLAVIVWFALSTPFQAAPAQVETFQQEIEGIQRSTVMIEATTGRLWVGAGADPAYLVEGEFEGLTGVGFNEEYSVSDGVATYSLKAEPRESSSYWVSGRNSQQQWRVKLNSSVPLELQTKMILGEQKTNLSGLSLDQVRMENVLGKAIIYLPADGDFELDASAVIGQIDVYLLQGTPLQIELDTGMTSVTTPPDFVREGDMTWSPAAVGAAKYIRLKVKLPFGVLAIHYID